MLEPEVFRKQMHCIEECTCDIVGTFRRPIMFRHPGNCAPPSLRPLPTAQRPETLQTNYSSEKKQNHDKCKQSDKAWSTQMLLLVSQPVIIQTCYGAIHEIACHLFIYAAPGATRKNWNETSKSSSNLSSAKRCGNAFPPLHPWFHF